MRSSSPAGWVSTPLAYLITFSCYGARLHGEDKATVDRNHNVPEGRHVPEDRRRARAAARLMNEPPSRAKRWARHGSTRWLWTPAEVKEAVSYVLHGQGEPMACYDGMPDRDRC